VNHNIEYRYRIVIPINIIIIILFIHRINVMNNMIYYNSFNKSILIISKEFHIEISSITKRIHYFIYNIYQSILYQHLFFHIHMKNNYYYIILQIPILFVYI